ncbi:tetratricopeptide repeat protein [Spirulina sp. CS-785/01]|uniref:CheR family methyltransferase n=1 Tax=Spirulina sp. CS-785/01 TaxID=3021716 RepID=UPI00232E61CC|nr:CheR family methyltransferase [Spirulina sp. CS-785/01]MDB9312077.1 tetratricopeptide repeat protein [Spirulina sp. CS-785/01]
MQSSGVITVTLLQAFCQLIARRTGLQIREQDYGMLTQKIWQRLHRLNLSRPETYYQLLETNTSTSAREWEHFIQLLTNIESYFFRDRGQFKLLSEQILPELIQRNQHQRRLRIWSAGCSTGEEPYSLAMTLHSLLPNFESWEVQIIGTDINQAALQKAKKGVYSPWSLRSLSLETIQKYFKSLPQGYQLNANIRHLVQFETFNLVENLANQTQTELSNLDLIICRNVFIYFTPEGIHTALKNFKTALKEEGYLLTGHAELYGQVLQDFQSAIFPDSIIYTYRPSAPATPKPILDQTAGKNQSNSLTDFPKKWRSSRSASVQPSPVSQSFSLKQNPPFPQNSSDSQDHSTSQLLQEAETLFAQKYYHLAAEKARLVLQRDEQKFSAYFLLASIAANSGEYAEAKFLCYQALEIDSFAVSIYYLLAQIAEEQEDIEEAKRLFKKIIYLDPNSVPAYSELSYIYDQEGDQKRAQKMQQAAMELLQKVSRNGKKSDSTSLKINRSRSVHQVPTEFVNNLDRKFNA